MPFSTIEDVLASAVLTRPAPLVVEIVSQNWQDDYLIKLAEYETLLANPSSPRFRFIRWCKVSTR